MKCDKKYMLLYAVTDRAWVGKQSLYEQVESALKGGATCVQLREKELNDDEFLAEAVEIGALCRKYSVPFFVNDNVDVAIKCHADGVHVGQEDMTASKVREKIGGDMMLGVSVHTVEEALEAVKRRLCVISARLSISRSSPSAAYPRAISCSFPARALTELRSSAPFSERKISRASAERSGHCPKTWCAHEDKGRDIRF